MRKTKSRIPKQIVLFTLLILFIVIVIKISQVKYPRKYINISSESMSPSLKVNATYRVGTNAGLLKNIQRNDVIVHKQPVDFGNPINPDAEYIHRVIGLPGEELSVISGRLFINGELFESIYILNWNLIGEKKTLEDNQFFVLPDSGIGDLERSVISRSDIIGKISDCVKSCQ